MGLSKKISINNLRVYFYSGEDIKEQRIFIWMKRKKLDSNTYLSYLTCLSTNTIINKITKVYPGETISYPEDKTSPINFNSNLSFKELLEMENIKPKKSYTLEELFELQKLVNNNLEFKRSL